MPYGALAYTQEMCPPIHVQGKSSPVHVQDKSLPMLQCLFIFCTSAFDMVISPRSGGIDVDSSITSPIREERGRFKLWGDGFSVSDGLLDTLLLGTIIDKNLWDSAVILLCSQARSLISILKRPELSLDQEAISRMYNSLVDLLTKATKSIPDHEFFDESLPEGYSREAIYSEIIKDDYDLDDIKDHNDSLLDLATYIEHPWSVASDNDRNKTLKPSDVTGSSILGGGEDSESYRTLAQKLFPRIDKNLLSTLIESQSLREIRLREGLKKFMGDSKIDENNKGRVILPNETIEFPLSTGYCCGICSDVLGEIHDKEQLGEHVLNDIQPYSCLFTSCAEGAMTFRSSTEWMDHEFQRHRNIFEWVCIGSCGKIFKTEEDFQAHTVETHLGGSKPNGQFLSAISNDRKFQISQPHPARVQCNFCQEEVEETRHQIESHVGDHMKALALEAFSSTILSQTTEVETNVMYISLPLEEGLLVPIVSIASPPGYPNDSIAKDDSVMSHLRRVRKLGLEEAIKNIPQQQAPPPDYSLLPHNQQSHRDTQQSITDSSLLRYFVRSHERDGDSEDDGYRIATPIVYKKNGRILRSSLKVHDRTRPIPMPSTHDGPKVVHFDARLESIKHFFQNDKPSAVSGGRGSAYPNEEEPPFEWEISLPHFPKDLGAREHLHVRVESVCLSSDNKYLVVTVATTSIFKGSINNISSQNSVVVRFTRDCWETCFVATADPKGGFDGKQEDGDIDRSIFKIEIVDKFNSERRLLFFYAQYNTSGQEYLDDNSGSGFGVEFSKKVIKSSRIQIFKEPEDTSLSKKESLVCHSSLSSRVLGGRYDFNRYDFGASLHAAIKAANPAAGPVDEGFRRIPYFNFGSAAPSYFEPSNCEVSIMKSTAAARSLKNASPIAGPIVVEADIPVFKQGILLGQKSSSESASYRELLENYCFFGSPKATGDISTNSEAAPLSDGSRFSAREPLPLMGLSQLGPDPPREESSDPPREERPDPPREEVARRFNMMQYSAYLDTEVR